LQETLTTPGRELDTKKVLDNVEPEKEMATDKNNTAKKQMATELREMGLTPKAITRLLNLNDP